MVFSYFSAKKAKSRGPSANGSVVPRTCFLHHLPARWGRVEEGGDVVLEDPVAWLPRKFHRSKYYSGH